MKILQGLDGLRSIAPGAVLTVGNFDGLHRGHQRLLALARHKLATGNLSSLVAVTFEPHPLTVLNPAMAPPRLTTQELKHDLLRAGGVDTLVELPPTKDVLDLAAEQFWAILRDQVKISHIVVGHDFTFGKARGGTLEKLRQWTSDGRVAMDIVRAVQVGLLDMQLVPISSTLVRFLIGHGRVRDAAICLGRPYTLTGPVVEGFRRGRTIGFPTINLQCDSQLVPADGVYAARCRLDGKTWPVALSIGAMPTFGASHRQIEGHIIGYSGDLYGQTMHLELVDWLRDQRKFAAVELLKRQLAADCATVGELYGRDPAKSPASGETHD